MDIMISIPVSYVHPLTMNRETLVDIKSVSMKSAYNHKIYDIQWMYNDTMLILNPIELSKLTSNGSFGESNIASKVVRKQRSIGNAQKHHYNHYLQRIIETDKTTSVSANELSNLDDENAFDGNDRILADLPFNRTVYLNCNGVEKRLCLHGKFSVVDFKANESPILISVNFTVDHGSIAKIMTENKDFMVIQTAIKITRPIDENV